jgi:hypothetical protein
MAAYKRAETCSYEIRYKCILMTIAKTKSFSNCIFLHMYILRTSYYPAWNLQFKSMNTFLLLLLTEALLR